jgi:hypothetical protein
MRFLGVGCTVLCVLFWTAPLSATQPIAHWDVVPEQMFPQGFKVGVVAFHEAGVSVEFRVNGTLKETVTQPTMNDQVKVVEYWTQLNPADYSDGPIRVTANVVPGGTGHTARLLDTLVLFANGHGTLTNNTVKWADCTSGSDATGDGSQAKPYLTVKKAYQNVGAGGTVYLKAGTAYDIAAGSGSWNSYQYWTTIQPAPGVAREAVKVKANRTDNNLMRYKGFSVYTTAAWGTVFYGGMSYNSLWADSLDITDERGKAASNASINHYATITYVTNCYVHDFPDGPGCNIVRNVVIRNILSDAISGADLAVNVLIDTINPDTNGVYTGAHPDVYQIYSTDTTYNKIVYNVRAYSALAQGLFNGGCPIEDIAFVNVFIEKDPNTVMYTQFGGYMRHTLFWHITLKNQTFLWREATDAQDLYVENCIVASMGQSAGVSVNGINFANNHFETGSTYGTSASTGNPQYVNTAAWDYHVQAGSPARGTGKVLACVPADMEGRAYSPTAPDKGAYSSYQTAIFDPRTTAQPASGMVLYPQPAGNNNIITIAMPGLAEENVTLTLLDVQGRVINKETINRHGESIQWQMREQSGRVLENGIYWITIKTKNNSFVQKIVKRE